MMAFSGVTSQCEVRGFRKIRGDELRDRHRRRPGRDERRPVAGQ
jgi:hypothetical protein